MPRKPIELPQIEYMSILDEDAVVDKALEPKIAEEELKNIYRYMLLARRTDERMLMMQRQGRLGTFPQSSGHEAISMGSCIHLKKSDWHVPAYRELAGLLYRGWSIDSTLLYWNGYEEGARPPEGVNDLPVCVPIASQLLHAAGIGMGMNLRGEKGVVMTYFGDGASSEGDTHEAMNFAAVYQAPVVFMCLNNQYAISVPLSKQMRNATLAQRAIAYGMPGIRVDGNDVLAVYVAAKEAVERARAGEGPTLIEGLTYRFTPHTTADDPKRYRSEEECNLWTKREPLNRFKKYLLNKGVYTEAQLTALEEELDAEIKAAIARTEAAAVSEELSNPLAMFDYLYADMPPYLNEQREELKSHLDKQKAKAGKSPQHASGTAR
ncbi:MAG: pyruvate dehydrogenase (acetyl-transferring) E1 component subunit alpha [Candidatus Obscuribacter sp.]|nr:pyruvate dehydrogenase (acetyl-transferring) E1 component subunit alpha [Candidatus Obscuribacter sp.]MBK9279392.1 pyruvate dehydrogenase (acetyl-transferring) E1 component subunit alpha [Candidatus Obscuribacter sp.]MBL8083279.1 pyruvate dehydrogenase (acetyl-transferring) E1 component subunit alpha [Candidatus Obscuribacter sp.]HMX47364.1 pyruvate dehydrogenase (acetyl-transferring) E1 component subunit alpha [Candidatus Obscuribacter sp.]HNH73624.1 pyruvate dehydrogenase (acetyl-transferr